MYQIISNWRIFVVLAYVTSLQQLRVSGFSRNPTAFQNMQSSSEVVVSQRYSAPRMHLFPEASSYIATVSADIDNISTDNFAEVFTGGIAVMLGGVASSLIVGIFLEFGGGKYEDIINDSYDGKDEYTVPDSSEWTEEQKTEFESLAQKFVSGKVSPSGQELIDFMRQFDRGDTSSTEMVMPTQSQDVNQVDEKERDLQTSMFNDYDD